MNEKASVDLSSILEKARLQLESKLSRRAYHVTPEEIIAMVQEGGELVGHLMHKGKQTVLVSYEGLTFQTESSKLLVILDQDPMQLASWYVH